MNTADKQLGKLPDLTERVWVGPTEYVGGRAIHFAKYRETGSYLKMGLREAFLLKQLDGKSTFDDIAAGYLQKFGKRLAPSSMMHALKLFERSSLTRAPKPVAPPSPAGTSGVASHPSLLNQKLCFWNPDANFARISPFFKWLVNWPAILLWSSIILCSEWVTYKNITAIWHESNKFSGYILGMRALALFTVYFLATLLHEAGHGVACKRYGGEVREMGIMLRYFMLAAYTRIDDILLFERRGRRIQVLLVGPLISLTIIPCALLIWMHTESSSLTHLVVADLLIFYNVVCLIQFLPFLQFDGYFMLAQLLRMPELRRDAAAYVFRRIIASTTGRTAPRLAVDCARYVGPTLAVYGIASFFVTFGALTWLAFQYSMIMTSWVGKTGGLALTVLALGYVAARLYLQFLPWARQQYASVLTSN